MFKKLLLIASLTMPLAPFAQLEQQGMETTRVVTSNAATFNAGQLTFKQSELSGAVQISLLDAQGKMVRSVLNTNLSSGIYSMGINRKGLPLKMYVVKIATNHQVQYIPMPSLANSSSEGLIRVGDIENPDNSLDIAATGGKSLGKTLAAWNGDTNTFWGPRGSSIPVPSTGIVIKFLNRTNGAWPDDSIFWEIGGVIKSLKEQNTYTLTTTQMGRVSFYIGKSKALARASDFIEQMLSPTMWAGNTTRVDKYGLPIAIRFHAKDGYDAIVGEKYDVFYYGRQNFFNKFIAEVPSQFDHLATMNGLKSIAAPAFGEFKPTGLYKDYYKSYVDAVWSLNKYTTVKPTTQQVFQCAGSLGADPRLCAALNRTVARSSLEAQKDPSKYYLSSPSNYYAKFFHKYSFDNKTYAFAYDDYNAQASYIQHNNPHYLLVAIGY